MAPAAWRTANADAHELRLELGPPGFVGFYRLGLATTLVAVTMLLPLALIGLFGALFWRDFPVALRLVMGLVGGAGTFLSLWLPVRLVLRATSWRARIRVRPGGVFVEAGYSAPRTTWWLTPRGDVTVDKPRSDELGRGGLVLCRGDQQVRLAVGHRASDRDRLLETLQRALAERPADPGDPLAPAIEPLGPNFRARLRSLGRDLLRPLLRPTPYLLVDLGAMALTPLMRWLLVDTLDWRDAYPIAFGLFIAGLAARRIDGSYIAGLRHYLADDRGWGFQYMLAAIAIAIAGGGAMTPRLGPGLAFLVASFTAIGLHWALLRRARGTAPTPTPSRALDLALGLTLIPICLLHEAGLFSFLVNSSRGLGPLALAFVPPLALVGYLPIRLHAFVDEPGDRSNVAWFWLTVAALAMQPLLALGPAIARELR